MGLIIDDGTGTNGSARVDKERLFVDSVIKTKDQDINERTGKSWVIPFEGLNPAGADDYVVYIKNTGDNNLVASSVRLSCDTAASQIEFQAVSGTAAGGSDITPVSKTVGSSASPSATIQSGTDITGLSNDGVLDFIQCAVVNTQYSIESGSKIIIPKGKAVALLVETATANLTGVISIYEEA